MKIVNEINGRRWVMISEKVVLDLEGRCSIQLSYERSQKNFSGWPSSAQAWLSGCSGWIGAANTVSLSGIRVQ